MFFLFLDYAETITGLMITLAAANTLSISWTYRMNGSSPRIESAVEIRLMGTVINTVIERSSQTILTSLLPLTGYNITVYVVTSVGRSLPATIFGNTSSFGKYNSSEETHVFSKLKVSYH